MQIEVKPILISFNLTEGMYPKGQLFKSNLYNGRLAAYWDNVLHYSSMEKDEPQHLYMVNPTAPIKEGDWYTHSVGGPITVGRAKGFIYNDTHCYKKIVAATDRWLTNDGVPSISEEFVREFTKAAGKGKILMVMEGYEYNGVKLETPVELCEFKPKLDNYGNAILTIEHEDSIMNTPLLNNDGELMRCEKCNAPLRYGEVLLLGYCEKCCCGTDIKEDKVIKEYQKTVDSMWTDEDMIYFANFCNNRNAKTASEIIEMLEEYKHRNQK